MRLGAAPDIKHPRRLRQTSKLCPKGKNFLGVYTLLFPNWHHYFFLIGSIFLDWLGAKG
jgi:hypothetical protein